MGSVRHVQSLEGSPHARDLLGVVGSDNRLGCLLSVVVPLLYPGWVKVRVDALQVGHVVSKKLLRLHVVHGVPSAQVVGQINNMLASVVLRRHVVRMLYHSHKGDAAVADIEPVVVR